jgi:hypothetical protein
MDVWGPAKVRGKNGERFFLSIIDDFSRKASVYPMRSKAEVFNIFLKHVARAERFLERDVKAIRTDNGTEFLNENFKSFCSKYGIKHELTNVYTPEQNGVAERYNQTVTHGARAVLHESKLDLSFWPEAILYFAYSFNRICHKDQRKTPFELFGGSEPSVNHLKPFGITAYVGIPKQRRSKFSARAEKGILVGYAFRTKGYRVWLPDSNKIVESINVSFKEFPDKAEDSGAVLGTNTESSTEESSDDEGNDPIYRSEYNPLATHSEEEDETNGQSSEDEETSIRTPSTSLRNAVWVRKPVPRPDGTRTDIYYYERGNSRRLRSLKDVREYCLDEKIQFVPHLFSFKGSDLYEGEISTQPSVACAKQA